MSTSLKNKLAYLRRYLQRKSFVFGRNTSLLKIVNFVAIELQERYAATRVRGMPYSIFLDPVNICPLHCPLCGTGLGQQGRPQKILSYNEFVGSIKPLEKYLYHVKFYNYGEPFLNPELPQMIRYAREHRIATQVNSNLNRLTPHYCEKIVDAGLDVLVVSFDGFTQNSYTAYRVGGNLETVKQNIALFNRIKQEKKSTAPNIVLQFIITRHNEHEYRQIETYAQEVRADFLPVPITLDITNKEHRDNWLPANQSYSHYDRIKLIKKKYRPDRKCGFLWNNAVINVDGGVSPCCHLYFKSTDFGSLNRNSFKQIWNNENFIEARKMFKQKRIGGTTTACSRCIQAEAFFDIDKDLINENRTNNLT